MRLIPSVNMRFDFVDKSQLWSGIAILMFGSGILAGLGGMISVEKVVEIKVVEERFKRVVDSEGGCRVTATIIGKTLDWATEYSDDALLERGLQIENPNHCEDLQEKFPNRVAVSSELVPSKDGPIVESRIEEDRNWSAELGRRLMFVLGGILIGFVAALPWIAVYQVTRRLEEIRDRAK
jgi:hypothetical protein